MTYRYAGVACQAEVVWAESKRTGRKYLANVARGYMDQRFYIGASIHKCAPRYTEDTVMAAWRVMRDLPREDYVAHDVAYRIFRQAMDDAGVEYADPEVNDLASKNDFAAAEREQERAAFLADPDLR